MVVGDLAIDVPNGRDQNDGVNIERNMQQSLVVMASISIYPSTKFNIHIVECFNWALWAGIRCCVIRF